jgi:RimJ/RimL family protein N-acetyltransferase
VFAQRIARASSQVISLVEPFPVEQVSHVYEWLKAYPLIGAQPGFPSTPTELIEAVQSESSRSWAVIEESSGEAVGFLLLAKYGTLGAQAFVASARRAWGKGWMVEAGREAINQSFSDDPSLDYIFGLVVEANAPAASYNRRVGMRLKNTLPDYAQVDGKLSNMLVFELTRESWKAANS